jgi:hypothetical protein
MYVTPIASDQEDENKLIGFSDNGQFFPHKYGCRFGWDWDINNKVICLSGYTYNIGIREIKELCTVPLNTEVNCSIHIMPSTYVFTVNGQNFEMNRLAHTKYARGALEYPYIGGNSVLDHDVNILLEIL